MIKKIHLIAALLVIGSINISCRKAKINKDFRKFKEGLYKGEFFADSIQAIILTDTFLAIKLTDKFSYTNSYFDRVEHHTFKYISFQSRAYDYYFNYDFSSFGQNYIVVYDKNTNSKKNYYINSADLFEKEKDKIIFNAQSENKNIILTLTYIPEKK